MEALSENEEEKGTRLGFARVNSHTGSHCPIAFFQPCQAAGYIDVWTLSNLNSTETLMIMTLRETVPVEGANES